MSKKVLVPIANGTEELEAVTIIDVLRRAEADVTVASIDNEHVRCSRGVMIIADKLIVDCAHETYDLIALPGGMPGAEHLRDSIELTHLLKAHVNAGKLYGAICAAPVVVLNHHGLLSGKKATCHGAFIDQLENSLASEEDVVTDGNCVTSRGPGTAMAFALTLVERLFDAAVRGETARPMHTAE